MHLRIFYKILKERRKNKMTNKEMEEMIKVLARHVEFILEQISYLYDTIGATPIYASNIDRDDEAKIRKLIKY